MSDTSKPQHSLAPWTYEVRGNRGGMKFSLHAKNEKKIGQVYRLEDARLIASAPDLLRERDELLAALRNIIHYWDVMPSGEMAEGGSDELIMSIKDARPLIARIEARHA